MYYVNLQLEFTTFCQFHIKANKKSCEVRKVSLIFERLTYVNENQ